MEQTNIWIVTLVALGIGALIGFLLGRAGGSSNREQELVDELDNARAELDSYKRQVNRHFEQTAELVNGLTDQYRKVHQHLAASAESLCPGLPASAALQHELRPSMNADIPTVTDALDNHEQEELPEPPRDYAPKKPDEAGTLSEEYGFDRKKQDEELAAHPATSDPTAYGDDAPEEARRAKA
ncbi:YhcB family protein [Marinobacterium sediminicola]|uniref:Z-ring associated protein G n=1 Tax=Marinobacterium sediminicola TaxID=518898 RepID=A0ABY1RY46_9GAMM|nr:DUF1043 family protein [Marinobacterium sediminicola]ULG68660.1 YhcB family protein [Marinobacterium sediminicola]SMR73183.1 hypothetical protein SAMN04487964_103124 [Marinobacterium sediminicola]